MKEADNCFCLEKFIKFEFRHPLYLIRDLLFIKGEMYDIYIVVIKTYTMLKKLYTLSLITFILLLSSCNKENDQLPNLQDLPVSFNSSVIGVQTRVVGNNWERGDKIGVFAIDHGTTLQETTIIENYDNLSFSTIGNGKFTHDGQPIYYPKDGSAIDFISYYPFKPNLTSYSYQIDIAEQIDLLYSNNLKNVNKQNTNNDLEFNRVLSNLILSVVPKGNGSLEGLTVEINGAKTKATFSLVDGSLVVDETSSGDLLLTSTGTETNKEINYLLLPTTEENSIEIVFKVDDVDVYKWKVPHVLERGKRYSYKIRLGDITSEVTPSTNYMEIPLYTSQENAPNSLTAIHIVESISWLNGYAGPQNQPIRNYTVLYDTINSIPYWIAFPMHPIYLDGGNRTDDWAYDPKIPEYYQPDIVMRSFPDASLDRGHMLASGDRSASRNLNRTTFYVSNMVPQDQQMNRGSWNNLENKVRFWCQESAYDTLYVVTGSMLPPQAQIEYTVDNSNKQIAKPKYLYKALLKQEKSSKKWHSIAFKMENDNSGVQYTERVVSVAELEEETGFTFFPNLTDAAEVKNQKSMVHWN